MLGTLAFGTEGAEPSMKVLAEEGAQEGHRCAPGACQPGMGTVLEEAVAGALSAGLSPVWSSTMAGSI